MDRRVTSPTWGPPPPCKQALNFIFVDCLLKATENSVWSNFTLMELMGWQDFHIILRQVLYQGSQLLQILLKTL